MATNTLDATVKARVSGETKRKIENIAASRELEAADIVREALREYLLRHPIKTKSA